MTQAAIQAEPTEADRKIGLYTGMFAYTFWGFFPLFLKFLDFADVREVLAQRVLWSVPAAALAVLIMSGGWRVALREATTGMLVGLMVAPIAFGQALLWKASLELALTVSVTMFAICVWSTTVGALVPILAQRAGVDPAVLSAPLITTLVDATGLIIYFSIAKAILGL